jgi:hypothetical protein
MLRTFVLLGATVVFGAVSVYARKTAPARWTPLTPQQKQLVGMAISQEKQIIAQIRKSAPLVQSYIQNMRPDDTLYQVPVSDQYMIGRVDFGKAFFDDQYADRNSRRRWFSGSHQFFAGLSRLFHLENSPTGFMAMMFVDPSGFDEQHYEFQFVRREFLGTVRTAVFDVQPIAKGPGRFYGRIWIEDRQGAIVRFNGTYTNQIGDEDNHYFHFDSWRSNVQPGLWAPAAVYVEDDVQSFHRTTLTFRGQTTYWGYSLKLPGGESDAESVVIENAEDQSDSSADVSPLEAERQWVQQAEFNVLDRLVQAGLVAPPSAFDKVLEQVTNNLLISNNLQLPFDVRCRVILTDPLETLAVGDTILISKGLVDVLPNEEALAAVLSFQLAHMLMGHRIDTRYAFNDRLLFPDDATFRRITMTHSAADDAEAAKRGVDLFLHSNYGGKASGVALFLAQIAQRQKALASLLTPRLGDSLFREDGQPWMAALAAGAAKIDVADLTQIAALPLNSRIKVNPWDDTVSGMNFNLAPLLSARDKMPLEIAPLYFRLQRYQEPPVVPGAAAEAPAPSVDAGPSTAPAAAAPAESAPAATSGSPQTDSTPSAPIPNPQ